MGQRQQTVHFERVDAGLWDTVREFIDDHAIPEYCRANGIQKKYLAADLGLSPAELRRKLAPTEGDKRRFSTDDLENWLQTTGDLSPLFYLFEKYALQHESRIAELEAEIVRLRRAERGAA